MRCTQHGGASVPGLAARVGLIAVAIGAGTHCAQPANADIFHLKTGGTIEGEVLERNEAEYKVRTTVGAVTLPVDLVERVEQAASPFAEYESRAKKTLNTPAAHLELAAWCGEHGLNVQRREHLNRAIELNPNYGPARHALGFVRVGGIWVDGDSVESSPSPGPQNAGDGAAGAEADPDTETLVTAIQGQWRLRIRSIKDHFLERGGKLAQEGRRKILEIQDPLAIAPLAEILARGGRFSRRVLIEVLSGFPQDHATMHLAVLTLVDGDTEVRRQALLELKRRGDPRVVSQFRKALLIDNDHIIRRAAEGLGVLEASSAVPDLIAALTAQRRMLVEDRVETYFGQYPQVFDQPTVVHLGRGRTWRLCDPVTGSFPPIGGSFLPTMGVRERNVTVYQNEVREALRRITGKDFGFDAAAWSRWYEEQES